MDAIPHALGLNPILISPKILEIGPKIKAKLRKIPLIVNITRVIIKNSSHIQSTEEFESREMQV